MGFGSLHALRTLPINMLKTDCSFILPSQHDPRVLQMVRPILQMAYDLGIETVVEGVETPERLALLQVEGCTAVQCYLLARPMTVRSL
jgi:EAL domain-containing protein (putative c-di-GMP-specific phosphodiesterase class I)